MSKEKKIEINIKDVGIGKAVNIGMTAQLELDEAVSIASTVIAETVVKDITNRAVKEIGIDLDSVSSALAFATTVDKICEEIKDFCFKRYHKEATGKGGEVSEEQKEELEKLMKVLESVLGKENGKVKDIKAKVEQFQKDFFKSNNLHN